MDTFYKQPGDTLDYIADFSDFLRESDSDTLASATSSADTGITIDSTVVDTATGKVAVWLSGGTTGTTYKVTITGTTAHVPPRIKDHEFRVKVKEL